MTKAAHPDTDAALFERVEHALEHASHLLPDQAPIRVFVHHNTLHAFQHLPFHEAVLEGQRTYGAEPYLSERAFREQLRQGRIDAADLEAALRELPGVDEGDGPLAASAFTRRALRRLSLFHDLEPVADALLRFRIDERQATKTWREDVPADARRAWLEASVDGLQRMLAQGEAGLLRVGQILTGNSEPTAIAAELACVHGIPFEARSLRDALTDAPEALCIAALWATSQRLVSALGPSGLPVARAEEQARGGPRLHRDIVLERTGIDVFDRVFPELIRLSAAYLDKGLASWSMPGREAGFYRAVRELLVRGTTGGAPWIRRVRRAFSAQLKEGLGPREVVVSALRELGVLGDDVEPYLSRLLLSLPGFAGMIGRLEAHAEDRPHGGPPASLLEWLSVRLTYEVAALRHVVEQKLEGQALSALLEYRSEPAVQDASELGQACRLFGVLQLTQVELTQVASLTAADAAAILDELSRFDSLTRRRVFQEAYERHYRVRVLDALVAHRARITLGRPNARPRFQVVTCFDDREESLRRHIEEVSPDAETFGAPGFFGAAMRFRGIDETLHVPLAPVVMSPVHAVSERPRNSELDLYTAREQRSRWLRRVLRDLHVGSRSMWRGFVLSAVLGLLAVLPLLVRIVSPRTAGRIRRVASRTLLPSPRTELTVHHETAADIPRPGTLQVGFTEDERVTRVASVLENIGLTHFAPLIVVLGHGANTLNNPHKSAYDCGACGGRQGGPNARVFCQMANDPSVRVGLRARGIEIPEDTWFVGGQHDTCSDEVVFFDVEAIPSAQREAFLDMTRRLDEARARTAQERCRRLFSAPLAPTPARALAHVEARREHLAQPRPEFGHATNAVAIIGRRALTRSLFLDRRAFLLSYDPSVDEDGHVLERVLVAATPVGAGINLEYYFSHVDNEHYGAGSKLPHNITGYLGVMTGHASDLRTGLPRQMIEIHEPMRLVLVVEATVERLLAIAARNHELSELVTKRWVQLVALHPDTGAMHVFGEGGFVPHAGQTHALPWANSSYAHCRGQRGFVAPASIVDPGHRAA